MGTAELSEVQVELIPLTGPELTFHQHSVMQPGSDVLHIRARVGGAFSPFSFYFSFLFFFFLFFTKEIN